MVLIITYALKNKLKDYTPLFEAIKVHSTEWFHFMDSSWIVSASYSADEFARLLFPYFETTDYLLVARLQNEHQGWLPKEAWDWLNSKFY